MGTKNESSSAKTGQFGRGLLALSLLANLTLLATLLIIRENTGDEPTESEDPHLTQIQEVDGNASNAAGEGSQLSAIKKTTADGSIAKLLVAQDFVPLDEKLTELGIPDSVRRDMLLPEINRKFQNRYAASYAFQAKRFGMSWKPAPGWSELAPRRNFPDVEDEHKLTLTAVFGDGNQMSDEEKHQTWSHQFGVSDSRMIGLDGTLEKRIHSDGEEIMAMYKNMRKLDPRPSEEEIGAAVAKRRAEQKEQFSADIPADEFEEYQLRHSSFTGLARDVQGVELTPDEMREIVRKFESSAASGDQDFTSTMAEIKSLLDDQRFAQYEPEARRLLKK